MGKSTQIITTLRISRFAAKLQGIQNGPENKKYSLHCDNSVEYWTIAVAQTVPEILRRKRNNMFYMKKRQYPEIFLVKFQPEKWIIPRENNNILLINLYRHTFSWKKEWAQFKSCLKYLFNKTFLKINWIYTIFYRSWVD